MSIINDFKPSGKRHFQLFVKALKFLPIILAIATLFTILSFPSLFPCPSGLSMHRVVS